QAEDGIRDFHVTGVQTCALPILCRNILECFIMNFVIGRKIEFNNVRRKFLEERVIQIALTEIERAKTRTVGREKRKDFAKCAWEIGRASCREREEMTVGGVTGRW